LRHPKKERQTKISFPSEKFYTRANFSISSAENCQRTIKPPRQLIFHQKSFWISPPFCLWSPRKQKNTFVQSSKMNSYKNLIYSMAYLKMPGSINPPPLEIGLERGARSFRTGLVGLSPNHQNICM